MSAEFDVDEMLTVTWARFKRARRRVTLGVVLGAGVGHSVGLPWGIPIGFGLAAAVFAFGWRRWREYVLNGPKEGPIPPPQYSEPGNFRIVLTSTGPRWRQVADAVCEVRDVNWRVGKAMAYSLPSVLATHVSAASAERIKRRVTRVGGTVEIHAEAGRPSQARSTGRVAPQPGGRQG
jgi:ribosomal protein L7/L12